MASETKEDIENQPFLKYSDDVEIPKERESEIPPRSTGGIRQSPLFSSSLVFIITSFLWVMLFLITSSTSPSRTHHVPKPGERHNITSNAHLLSCGNTSTSARAAGCTYDSLLNHWVPAPCYDAEFVEEYLDDGSWAAYADEELTQLLRPEDMEDREHYYTSVRDHINHCAVMWKKQFFVLFEERRAIDTEVASPGHTDHCAYYLMAEGRNLTQSTKVYVGFAGCWIRDD